MNKHDINNLKLLCESLMNVPGIIHNVELEFFRRFLLEFRIPEILPPESDDEEDLPPESDSKIIQLSVETQKNPSALTFARRAQEYLVLERLNEAMTDCDSALSLNPDSAKALGIRAQIHAKRENWKQCSADLSTAQAIDYCDDLNELHKMSIKQCRERVPGENATTNANGLQNLMDNIPPEIFTEAQSLLHDPDKLSQMLQNPMFKQMVQGCNKA